MEKIIEFSNAKRLQEVAPEYTQVDNAYIFCRLNANTCNMLSLGETPLKLNGSTIILMLSGTPFDVEINLQKYTLKENTIMMAFPGNVVCLKDKLPADLQAYGLFFNLNFLQNVNISTSTIAAQPMFEKPRPVMTFEPEEIDILIKYFELLRLNAAEYVDHHISRNISTSILAAMFYQLVQFYHKRLPVFENTGNKTGGRRHDYVREFVRLVHIHFMRERSVSFYADKLYISPKYLSLLVKEATGRSAAKWIDDFVIMEAKNLLRFSGKNIQQVAYTLNFPTQSSFGKYFKHITGMSPTEYQKS